MAISSLSPGNRPANSLRMLSDYDLLAMPHAMLPVPPRPARPNPAAWRDALDRYRVTEKAYQTLYARRRPYAHPDEGAGCMLDDVGLRLLADRCEQMHKLIEVPAPDWPALLTKLEIVYRDVFRDLRGLDAFIAKLVADARQLSAV